MFRNRGGDALPTTAGGTGKSSFLSLFRRRNTDGSARSISTTPSLQQQWKRASAGTKVTYITFIVCLLLLYFGYRSLRYNNAGINLNCHAKECTLVITPPGWAKKDTVKLARSQLLQVMAVKTDKEGNFISANPSLREDYYKYPKRKKTKQMTSNYKGPDENGHYLSYAIHFRDKTEVNIAAVDPEMEEKDISAVKKHGEEVSSSEYRIIVRRFNVGSSKRRVRIMMQKIESYIKHRRQQLLVKESTPPSWQSVVMIVFGLVGVLLSILIGQFIEEDIRQSGPGVRRQTHPPPPRSKEQDVYKRQTPTKYEVSTSARAVAAPAIKAKSATYSTTRKRY